MKNLLNRIRIPTLAGLTIIIVGMAAGIYLTLSNQTYVSQAAPEFAPNNVKITNIEDGSVSVSWVTDTKTPGFIVYSSAGNFNQTALDDLDDKIPEAKLLHHVSLKDLTPETLYQFKIVSGKLTSAPLEFTTAKKSDSQNELSPIIGSVQDKDQFLKSGIVYLEVPGAVVQSAPIKSLGNFIIPLSKLRTVDLSDIFKISTPEAKINVITETPGLTGARFILGKAGSLIGPLIVGQTLDLTIQVASPSALIKFDLNGDGIINASDHSIVLTNLGKKPKVPASDLNEDGIVDKKDLDIISSEIAKLENK
ncbi:hypothetical protein A2769_01045 [Candidatus Daviesbacteria bacterium RIFCSPHIGHO2_01_FULL_37_27]|nr:MAG: hypothetical protein A2111_02780 [Candidatus Daviesbacteria bacterium GWA1_38_6]OGE18002.1 MAG: hypothetical protein A2769_01045 [Candidatus Daviesbacteria bacterium RIFCSPHIGHO2_01_FULL_37_27]